MNFQKLLHKYWGKRLKALKKLFQVQINAIKEATKVALKELGRRLKQMNEIRDQLKVQKDEFYTRPEGKNLEKSLEDYKERIRLEIKPLQDQKLLLDNKADRRTVNIALIVSLIGLLLSLFSIIIYLKK